MIERFPAIDYRSGSKKACPKSGNRLTRSFCLLKAGYASKIIKIQNNQTAQISETNLLECQKNALVHHFAAY